MQLTIKQKLLALASIFLIVICIESVMSYKHVTATKQHSQTLIEQTLPLVATLRKMEMNVVQVQQWLTDISATRGLDGLNDGFDMAAEQANKFEQNSSLIASLDPELKNSISALKSSFATYYRVGQKMAHGYVEGGPEEGNQIMAQFDSAAEELHKKLDAMADKVEASLEKSLAEQQHDADSTSTQSMIAIGLLILFMLAAMISIQTLLISPLLRLKGVIANFNQGTANLNFRFNQQGSNEISNITNELDTFFDSLQSTTVELNSQATQLADEVSSTVSVAYQSHQGVVAQQDEIQMVTAAIEEMSATSIEVAQKAEMTAGETTQAKELATQGSDIVRTSIDAINSVAAKIKETSDVMNQLETDTTKIESMLDVIKSIAEQTNLLALNAAIEAARAGDQGRGFAVVADEVRTLAAKTQESTSEITQIINSLQTISNNAVQQMNESSVEVEDCVSKSALSGELMANISKSADEISDMTTQIAAAMEQQTAVSAEIARSVVKVHDVSIETAEGSELTITSMTNLDKNSKALLEIAHQFSHKS